MRSLPAVPVRLRILSIGIMAILLNLSHQPHALIQALKRTNLALNNSSPAGAAASLQEVLAFEPWRTDLWLEAGRYALAVKDYPTALASFEEVRKRDALSYSDWTALGDVYLALENPDQALVCWNKALELGGPSEELYQRMLSIYEARWDVDKILDTYRAWTILQPNNGLIHFKTGLYLAIQRPESALAYLEQAAKLDSGLARQARKLASDIRTASLANSPAYTLVSAGRSLASLGYWRLAKEAFQNAIRLEPDYAEAWAFSAEARQQLGGTELGYAWSDLARALELAPDSIVVNLLASLYYQRRGQEDQAKSVLLHAARLEPNNPIIYLELGNVNSRQGNLQEAETAYRKAVELNPEDISLRRALVNFYLKHQIQLREKALPIAREAVILAPEDAAALDLLGETLFLLGDLHNSRRLLERAVQQNPEYAPALMHLGVTLLYLAEPGPARQMLEEARRLAVDGETLRQAQRLLEYYFP